MKKYLIVAVLFLLLVAGVRAQFTLNQRPEEAQYQRLETAWIESNWTAAYQTSKEYLNSFPNASHAVRARFIHLYSGLKMGRENQDRACLTFLANYPQRPEAVKLRFALGDFYFVGGKYEAAISQYNQLTLSKLSRREIAEAEFKKGYSLYALGRRAAALSKLRSVVEYPGEYRLKAAYYSGFLLYQNREYERALTYLNIADEGALADVSALIADAYYQLGQGDNLRRYVEQRAPTASRESRQVLYRLLGEVYFEERQYRQAADAFEKALASSEGAMEAIVYYKNAVAYDKIDEQQRAIDNYKISGLDKSEIGQLSAFRLGQLYLEEDNYAFASQSFEQASASDYNESIREQSTFLSGKLRLAARAYDEGINKLLAFREAYPESKWSSEAAELVAQAFLLTSNYDRAMRYVEGLTVQSSNTRKTYQKVSFLKGEQLFYDGQFQSALTYLDKSFAFTPDFEVFLEGKFLAAEAYTNLEDPESAKRVYEEVQSMTRNRRDSRFFALSLYNLGYIAYNNREYVKAEGLFNRFLRLSYDDTLLVRDGKIRYADCLYVNKKYAAAKDEYLSLLSVPSDQEDYLHYQLGLLYYQLGNYESSASEFGVVANYPDSPYGDNALYQEGQMWFEQARFREAAQDFSTLMVRHPQSGLLPYALLRRGLSFVNLENYDAAQQDLVANVRRYPTHETANDAILALQDLQKRNVDVFAFGDVLAYFRQANPSNTSLESIDFEQIKTAYFRQDYDLASRLASQFNQQYPESNYQLDVQYYVADGFYQSEQWERAVEAFAPLVDQPNFGYYQRVLDKRGKALLALGNYLQAINNYHFLLMASRNSKEQYLAREGLMYGYLEMNPDSAFIYASLIREASWKPLNAELNARMVQLKIRKRQGRVDEAIEIAAGLVQDASNEIGAEANYYMASLLRDQGAFEQSNEACFDLLSNYASYSQWTDQAYLLLVTNYLSMEEILQAEATVNSILENAQDERILQAAKDLKGEVEILKRNVLQERQADSTLVQEVNDSIR